MRFVMFMSFVGVCLLILLVLSGGTALYLGLFKADGKTVSWGRKAFSGVVSYGASAGVWFFIYSFHYLGW